MGFFCDEDGEALAAGGREVNFDFHAQIAGGFFDVLLDLISVEAGGGPRGLEGHTELTAGDLLFEGFDVGAQLEEELGDAGDDAGFVVTDQGDGCELSGHGGARG